ncbi:MAG: polymer-forming cytoskeletal protein [Actinomycetota bacterium]|nr:polymer-forming cytoskeletal protein [Actinomycetota bacterium]
MSIRGRCSISSVKPSRSDSGSGGIRYRAVTFVALLFAVAPLLAAIAPSVVTTDLFIVDEDDPITEDVYVASTSGRVEGIIDGDLVITTGDLSISGIVTGNVLALTSGAVRLEQGGVIEGSLRTATPQVQVDGEIGGDLFVTGIATGIGSSGVVGRDVIMFGGTLTIDGTVGRDVRGRLFNASVSGTVGRDIDLAVQRLVVDDGASVSGDVLYRSTNDAVISDGTVSGQIVQLPAQSNFIFGVILTLANIIGFLAFIVSGIFLLWLFRATGAAAVEAVEKHPVKTGLVGLGSLIGAPLLVLLLAITLVGLPLAMLLMIAMLLAFVFGPIPAVGAVGDLLLRRKGGLFGGFLIGAVLWRLGIWLIPFVGAFIYLAGLIWGTGGWVLAAWRLRKTRPAEREALPAALMAEEDDIPEDWAYPLPPESPFSSAPSSVPPTEGQSSSSPSSSAPSTEGRGDAEERSDDAGEQITEAPDNDEGDPDTDDRDLPTP